MKIIHINIFPSIVVVVFRDRKMFKKALRGLKINYNVGLEPGCVVSKDSFVGIFLKKNVKQGIIAHECIHAAWHILDSVDIKVTVNNHEVLAYLTEFLVNKIQLYYHSNEVLH